MGTTTRRGRFSLVTEWGPGPPDEAAEHYASRLAFETDSSDLHADLGKGDDGLVILDVRSPEAYAKEHIPGAINLPHRRINASAIAALGGGRAVVTYCWGPGCNASTKAAFRLAELGIPVKELIGGIEYWKREGFPTEGSARVES